jgi:hypothetical protein
MIAIPDTYADLDWRFVEWKEGADADPDLWVRLRLMMAR